MLIYAPALSGPFVYEDAQNFAPMTWAQLTHGRSLTAASFALTPTPMAAHAFSLGVHLLNGLLLSALLWSLASPFAAWALTTLFLVHPLQSEAVAYITGRGELLAGLGTLIAVWEMRSATSAWRASCVIAVGGLIALSAKEATGASLLLWLPLLAWTFWKWGRVWLPLALWSALALWYAHALPPMPIASLGWMARQCAAVWHLVRLFLIPVGFSLETPAPFLPWLALASFAVCVVGSLLTARPARRLLGLWIAAGFLPRIVLAQPLPLIPEPLHEHHGYAILIGVCLALGLGHKA